MFTTVEGGWWLAGQGLVVQRLLGKARVQGLGRDTAARVCVGDYLDGGLARQVPLAHTWEDLAAILRKTELWGVGRGGACCCASHAVRL